MGTGPRNAKGVGQKGTYMQQLGLYNKYEQYYLLVFSFHKGTTLQKGKGKGKKWRVSKYVKTSLTEIPRCIRNAPYLIVERTSHSHSNVTKNYHQVT